MVGFAISLTACQKNEGLVSDAITTSSFTITIHLIVETFITA